MTTESFSLVMSVAVDVDELRATFEAAAPRTPVLYAYGLDLPRQSAAVRQAAAWAAEGRGHLVQQRDEADRRRTQWLVIKAGIGAAQGMVVPSDRRRESSCCAGHVGAESERDRLLALLRAAGATCPSNREIARQLGLGNDQRARRRADYLLGQLVEAGAIELTNNGTNQPRGLRVVAQ